MIVKKDWIGQTGFSCWEFVQQMDPSIPHYAEAENGFLRVETPMSGDVVLMERCDDEDLPFHAGYMVGERDFLHATKKLGVVRGFIDRWPYKGKVIGFYRWTGKK